MSRPLHSVETREGDARLGTLRTAHGDVATPAFMPVGTYGAVKGVTPGELRECGAEIVLSNTYHLFERPGHEVVRELGGLQRFMGWDGPILTDSGGFQAMSMEGLTRLDEDGVTFRSHIDGARRLLTPEVSMEVQSALGSDVVMVLDECPALPASREVVERAVERTTRWARRCREHYRGPGALFGIVQGGPWEELRERSVSQLLELDFPGYAIGGVSVGEPAESIGASARASAAMLPADRPRYLMGVGRPRDLVQAVAAGVDLFDCVMPTRNARNGSLFTSQGRMNIKRAEYRSDTRPIDERCPCPACRGFSRGYLRHLTMTREMLGFRLNTLHNLTYYLQLMRRMREAIAAGRFAGFRDTFLSGEGAEVPPG